MQDEPLHCATPDTLIDVIPKVELTEIEMYGESLFKSNCAACHKVYKNAVGPALYNVTEKYESEWLYSWIKNSSALIKSGDARAVSIYNEYRKANMNSFPQLSQDDIDAILAYTSMAKY
jgi:mono/diheme cytochrome c family protein